MRSRYQNPRRVLEALHTGRILVVAFCLAAAGCGSKPEFNFDYIDLLPAEQELAEFSFGTYKIPIPLIIEQGEEGTIRRNRLQLSFELFALVSPQEMSQFEKAWNRHEGIIRDKVISLCRNASVEELMEPELLTLKSRLTDMLANQLGQKRLLPLVISDVVTQELL